PVVDPLADGDVAPPVDLARVVQRAALAVLVAGVVDPDDVAGPRVDDRRAGRAADGLALGGVAQRVLPGPLRLAQPVDGLVDLAAVDRLPVARHDPDRGAVLWPGRGQA